MEKPRVWQLKQKKNLGLCSKITTKPGIQTILPSKFMKFWLDTESLS